MRYFVKINENNSNDFYVVTSGEVPTTVSSVSLEVSTEDHDKYFSNNGKYRFVISTKDGINIAVLEEIIVTTEEKLATAITNLNSIALSEIKIQENRYTAAMTSSSYTDAELTEVLTEVKTEKLAIVKKLISDQEALING